MLVPLPGITRNSTRHMRTAVANPFPKVACLVRNRSLQGTPGQHNRMCFMSAPYIRPQTAATDIELITSGRLGQDRDARSGQLKSQQPRASNPRRNWQPVTESE